MSAAPRSEEDDVPPRGIAAIESALRMHVRADHRSIEAAFAAFDADRDGRLGPEDFESALSQHLHLSARNRMELTALFARADINHDGYIDLGEFHRLIHPEVGDRVVRDALARMRTLLGARYHTMRDAFHALRPAGTGSLDRADIVRVLQAAGLALADGDLAAVLARFDPEDTGRITHTNFLRVLTT